MIWFSVCLLFLLIFGAGITYLYADKVEGIIVQQLNQKLTRPVAIKDIEFSFFRKFPKASVVITEITVQGLKKEDQAFIDAKKILLSFDMISLIKDEMVINEITAEDATIHIKINKSGKVNYEIFKYHHVPSSKGILNIQEVNLVNTKIVYHDIKPKIKIKAHSFNSRVHLNLSEQKILTCKWDGVLNKLDSREYHVENIPLRGLIEVNISQNEVLYSFTKGKIISLLASVEGKYSKKDQLNRLKFKLTNGDLNQLALLLDKDMQKKIIDRHPEGKLSASGVITSGPQVKSSLLCELELDNGAIQASDHFKIKGVGFSGSLNWKDFTKTSKAILTIKQASLSNGGSTLLAQGTIQGFNRLNSKLHLEGTLDIPSLVNQLYEKEFQVHSGQMLFNTMISGEFGSLIKGGSSHLKHIKSKGKIELKNLSFRSKEISDPISNVNGHLTFDNKRIKLETFTGQINSTKFELNGYLDHYLKKQSDFRINAKIKANQLILEEFLGDDKQKKDDVLYHFNLPKNLHMNLSVLLDTFSFRQFIATDLEGKVSLNDQTLTFNPLSFHSCDGEMSVKGIVDAKEEHKVKYRGLISLKNMDLKKSFFEMENFGQSFLLDRHVSGKIKSKVFFKSESDKQLNMDLSQLLVDADFDITEGSLVQFEPMMELQEFLKKEFNINIKLNNLQFKTLKNNISIKNQTVQIPEMKIASNALNLKVSGAHAFDQKINYLFKIKNKDLFKASKQNSIDLTHGIIDEMNKSSTLPLLMTGTVDEPKFTYDLKTKKEIIKNNLAQEGKAIKELVEKEINEIFDHKEPAVSEKNHTKFKVVWDE